MTPSEKTLAQILQIEGNQENYFVPKYQRPYVWKPNHWDVLLRDLEEEEEHFMGSLICVARIPNDVTPGERIQFELIDGQQRLTTLSILLSAIYRKLADCRPDKSAPEEHDDHWKGVRSSVYKKLISEKTGKLVEDDQPVEKDGKKALFIRVLPSGQGQNRDDYKFVLNECGALKQQVSPAHWGNRRIAKCYNHFIKHLPDDLDALNEIVERVNNLRFIHISVPTQSDAYRLFEALNNRGEPLSALDIIKNGLLARVEREKGSVDDAFELWKEMTNRLTEDETVQERYLRHFYHAFRHDKALKVASYPRATKSTIIKIYTELTNRSARALLNELYAKSALYEALIAPEVAKQPVARKAILSDLLRIGATPAHQALLFFLACEKDGLLETVGTFNEIASFLAKYFIRRNITDQPGTNRLDPIFSRVVEDAHTEIKRGNGISSSWVINKLKKDKVDEPADDETFRDHLADNLWLYDPGMARYIICRLNDSFKTREYDPNVWRQDDRGKFVWTVEHILPQAERLRSEWVAMLADGDKESARELQEQWVHCLGNLTLSGYNSKLSDRPFDKKKEKTEQSVEGERLQIGYKNKLPLNDLEFEVDGKTISLATAKKWTAAEIEARNEAIVDRCMKMFKL